MPAQILPAPSVVADTALSLLSGDLLAQWGFSLQHLALGLLLGAIAGTLLGALLAWCQRPRRPGGTAVLRAGANSDARLDPAIDGAVRD